MKFTLTITLGNDAMQTYGDVAAALRKIAGRIDDGGQIDEESAGDDGAIRDVNGNTVGKWTVVP